MTASFGYLAAWGIGLVLGLIGGGGSILTVPVLVYLFGMSAWDSTAHSLIIVGTTAFVGAILAYGRRELDPGRVLFFGVPGVLGVFSTRRFLMPRIPDQIPIGPWNLTKGEIVLLVFVALMLLTATQMILGRTKENSAKSSGYRPGILMGQGVAVGLVTGFVGAGGGFLIVPALVHFAGLPMRLAVGTSLGIIALQSLIGVLGEWEHLSQLNYALVASVGALAILGMLIGGRFRSRVDSNALKKFFGYFVFGMGLLIVWQELIR